MLMMPQSVCLSEPVVTENSRLQGVLKYDAGEAIKFLQPSLKSTYGSHSDDLNLLYIYKLEVAVHWNGAELRGR